MEKRLMESFLMMETIKTEDGIDRPLFCHLTVTSKEQLKFNIDQ